MIKTVGFYNHKPSSTRIIRNNTSEGNNTIFYDGRVIPGYNRWSQGYDVGWLSFRHSVWRFFARFWVRGTHVNRNFR